MSFSRHLLVLPPLPLGRPVSLPFFWGTSKHPLFYLWSSCFLCLMPSPVHLSSFSPIHCDLSGSHHVTSTRLLEPCWSSPPQPGPRAFPRLTDCCLQCFCVPELGPPYAPGFSLVLDAFIYSPTVGPPGTGLATEERPPPVSSLRPSPSRVSPQSSPPCQNPQGLVIDGTREDSGKDRLVGEAGMLEEVHFSGLHKEERSS